MSDYYSALLWATAAGVFISAAVVSLIGVVVQIISRRGAADRAREAEDQAFVQPAAAWHERLVTLSKSQAEVEGGLEEVSRLAEASQPAIEMGRLFNLYSKQIEKYQLETRWRATLSFIFATFAMSFGFGFVLWGGSVLLTANETIALAAGGVISTVGGAVSAFITKTFLDVHRLSLTQLNRYFRQPVINDHILMAQRLADESNDPDTRKKAYETIINSIAGLIKVGSVTTDTAE